jgi:dTDP-4-dehydrorhamnose reductase
MLIPEAGKQMKRILITGSNGLVGQKVVKELLDRGQIEVIATSFSPNVIVNPENFVFELMDISNPAEVEYIVDRYRPDAIIHTAAITQVAVCETQPDEAWRINVEAVEHLIQAANNCKAHFVFLSSDFVFDGLRGPYKEEDPTEPVSQYGKSKLEGEKKVMQKAASWCILRTCLVYGTNPVMSRPNFALWVKHALENKETIRVNQDHRRTPTLAEDLATACATVAIRKDKGIYHISGKEFMSVLEFAYAIADHFKLDREKIIPVYADELNEIGKRPVKTGFIVDKAMLELQFQPKSLQEGLDLLGRQLIEQAEFDD